MLPSVLDPEFADVNKTNEDRKQICGLDMTFVSGTWKSETI